MEDYHMDYNALKSEKETLMFFKSFVIEKWLEFRNGIRQFVDDAMLKSFVNVYRTSNEIYLYESEWRWLDALCQAPQPAWTAEHCRILELGFKHSNVCSLTIIVDLSKCAPHLYTMPSPRYLYVKWNLQDFSVEQMAIRSRFRPTLKPCKNISLLKAKSANEHISSRGAQLCE